MKKRVLWIIAVFVVGGFGGILFERTLIPWLAARDPFQAIPRLTLERVTVVQPKEESIIDRAQAVEKAVEASRHAVVAVSRQDAAGNILAQASGLVLTTDGVIVVPARIVQGKGTVLIHRNGSAFPVAVLRFDAQTDLALLKSEISGFSAPSFVGSQDIRLGSSVFSLRGFVGDGGALEHEVSLGVVRRVSANGTYTTSFITEAATVGAPVFTLEANVVGVLGDRGLVSASAIQELLEDNANGG